MKPIIATRYHDFCMGHTVTGHEGKCINLHGHNYRITFHCQAQALDELGRVIDFSAIKATLCEWVEEHWDHRFMIWAQDPRAEGVLSMDAKAFTVPFNPTAENIAAHMLEDIAPTLLPPEIVLVKVELEETRKCGVTCEL
jgi:6-pyruvoyltetrahydropterin/6-carboxytetrahydropterin synthase